MASPHTAVPVVVGLGNPGGKYQDTRHNIGFSVVDYLLSRRPFEALGGSRYELFSTRINDERVFLMKPLTFMNRSGQALLECPESVAAGPENHLVVLDDVALPFGAIRFRPGGSSGGQKGLASVLDCLGTEDVPRLRLGIGMEPERDLPDYVLDVFSTEEQKALGPWLERIECGIETFLGEGIGPAMNKFNG